MSESAPLMVGVSGLRGIVGASLTPEVAERFARAFGDWLREGAPPSPSPDAPAAKPLAVVIGADGRKGYEPIRDAAVRGLQAAGLHPIDLGVVMTPTVGFAADRIGALGGMVVTASHNPQEWNGLKCLVRRGGAAGVIEASAPPADVAAHIAGRFAEAAAAPPPIEDAVGRAEIDEGPVKDAARRHALRVVEALGDAAADWVRQRRFRVALDSCNGAGGVAGRVLLEDLLGCELVHLGHDASGVFPHPAEPLKEHLTGLCDAVKSSRCAVGFAQDPDADRLAVVDEKGRYIGEEYTLALAAEAVLSGVCCEKGEGAVVCANLSTSRMIDDVAARRGAKVVRSAVGEANVVEAMRRSEATGRVVLGGEGNGGVIWPRVTLVRDSLGAMALVLGLMATHGAKLSDLAGAIPAYAIEKRKRPLARREDAADELMRLAEKWSGDAQAHVDRRDGVRIDWPERRAWVHVRASNTEPILRLIAEAPTRAEVEKILAEIAESPPPTL